MRFIELQKGMVFTAWAASFNDENHTTKREGKEAGFGTIAVNSKQIPFGSVLEIETVDDGKKLKLLMMVKNIFTLELQKMK